MEGRIIEVVVYSGCNVRLGRRLPGALQADILWHLLTASCQTTCGHLRDKNEGRH